MPKQRIGLQCNITIPRRVTIIPDNRIEVNENSDVFKDLNEAPPSDDWFSCEYIDAEANKKVKKAKENAQAMKWKSRLNITWNLSIATPTG